MGLFEKKFAIFAGEKSVYWETASWKTGICARIAQRSSLLSSTIGGGSTIAQIKEHLKYREENKTGC